MKKSPFEEFSEKVDKLSEQAEKCGQPQEVQVLVQFRDDYAALVSQATQELNKKQQHERDSRST